MKLQILALVATISLLKFCSSNDTAASVYTRSEKEKLHQFRNMMQHKLYRDFMTKDKYLIRWLRNENMNLEKAKRKLSWSLDYRKENKIDSVLLEDYPEYKKYCKNSIDGRDRMGRAIFTSDYGTCKPRETIVRGLNGDRFKRRAFQVYEKIIKKIDDAPDNITDVIGISDASGFIREHACVLCIPLQLVYRTIQNDHYPLLYHRFFVINVPKVFENLYQLIRETFSEEEKKRNFVYGFNKAEWQPELLKFIASDQLTPQFGGTRSMNTIVHKS